MSSRLLRVIYRNTLLSYSSSGLHNQQWHPTLQNRSIFTTSHLDMSWVDKIKGVFTGNKPSTEEQSTSSQSFTLLGFAEQMKTARKLGSFKQYMVGGNSDATMAALEKHEAIIRYLGGFDPSGQNINPSQKQETAKKLNCSIQDVEGALSKFMWAKEAQKKMEKLKAEGKPMPKNLNEVQELMGSTPMDLARSNLLKTGQVSRNAMCPCGSKKRYKRCCGKDGAVKQ
ncbi:translocase subunit SecA-like [Thalictrum thalictroides]|uniref:Translocase subunit SecA-like n=1 Tax=Thalictrum thalictroides TaxID=46969 RepID=A0A7J6X9I4_THATH|nr:translocase subunit SecA-like [Thalictrum thalictroides]